MEELTQIAIAIVAAYGAALSTINQYLNWKSNKIQVRAVLSWGLFNHPDKIKKGYLIQIFNSGNKATRIESIEVPLPDRTRIFYALPHHQGKLPAELKQADRIDIIWEESDLDGGLKDAGYQDITYIRVQLKDKLGNIFYSNYINRKNKKPYGKLVSFIISKKERLTKVNSNKTH